MNKDESENKVEILIGSLSDREYGLACKEILDEFSVKCNVTVASAHRTPELVHKLVKEGETRGVQVFIAMAGMAAHLAGVVASLTEKPVIGVPLDGSSLNGIDSLLSTAQMPAGVPVATTAIGRAGAKNAAFLAMRILALQDKDLQNRLVEFKATKAKEIQEAVVA